MLLNVVVVLVIVCFTTIEAQKTYQYRSNFPVRLQWYENRGYCGETSLITAGLSLGGLYMSQYDARTECVGSGNQAKKEMLLEDGSDVRGAKAMKLVYESFNVNQQTSTEEYLVWVKQHVLQGHLVIIGVYNNEFIFYGDKNPNAGDPAYDHICPVLSIKSNHPLDPKDDTYYPDDEIVFSDNGLHTPDGTIPYKFSYTFGSFAMSRQQANAQNGPVYALPNINFNPALAILKVKDPERELKPVTLKTDPIWEKPTIKEGSSTRPKSMPLTITANVTALTKGRTYNCYEYNKLSKVPDRNFNANAKNARKKHTFTAKSSNQVLKFNIKSSDVFVLRCVDSKQKRRLREEPEELEREEKENSVELVV